MNKILKRALAALLVLLVCVGGFFGWFFSHIPKHGPKRIEVAGGVVGVFEGASYVWIIRTPHGAALIDAGLDQAAKAVVRELAAQGTDAAAVHTILLTHGHGDHFGGALAFANAKVYLGAEDLALAEGRRPPTAFGPKVFGMFGKLKSPPHMERLTDGQVIEADGATFRVIGVPGHTPGSMMFVHDDVLYTGDSLFGADQGVALAPDIFEEDAAENRRSLAKLSAIEFARAADGHTGLIEHAKDKLAALLR
jgi:glyoxylase-like metal-dependent hydrolase (beta-lactamase superfamily II)